jgi:hypothetical protein
MGKFFGCGVTLVGFFGHTRGDHLVQPVANGYHGWMIANPEQAADTVHDLLLVRLGDALIA